MVLETANYDSEAVFAGIIRRYTSLIWCLDLGNIDAFKSSDASDAECGCILTLDLRRRPAEDCEPGSSRRRNQENSRKQTTNKTKINLGLALVHTQRSPTVPVFAHTIDFVVKVGAYLCQFLVLQNVFWTSVGIITKKL